MWVFVISSEQKEIMEISAGIQQPRFCKLSVPGTFTDALEKSVERNMELLQ